MAGVTHQRPSVPRSSSEEIPFLHGAADRTIRRGTRDQRTSCGIGGQIADESGVRIGAPGQGLLNRGEAADQKLIVIGVKDDADVTIGIRDVHSERIVRLSPDRGGVPVPPKHGSRCVVGEVLLRLDLACDRGMPAVGPHNQARSEHVLLTCRPGGSHSDHAVSVSHK